METGIATALHYCRQWRKSLDAAIEANRNTVHSRQMVEKYESLINFYRSDEEHLVIVVEGLYERKAIYLESEWREIFDLALDLDTDCLELTITFKRMTGCEIGRLTPLE